MTKGTVAASGVVAMSLRCSAIAEWSSKPSASIIGARGLSGRRRGRNREHCDVWPGPPRGGGARGALFGDRENRRGWRYSRLRLAWNCSSGPTVWRTVPSMPS